MKSIPTFCRVCEPSCALIAQVDDGKVTRLQPDKAHPVSKGFACHKGINYLAIHQDPDRLDQPQVRQGSRRPGEGQWQPRDWDSAITDIGTALARIHTQHGPDAIAGYIGNPSAFNALGSQAIGDFFMAMGSRRIFNSGTQDCANKFAAGEAVFGTSTLHPVPDIENTDCLLMFGENPKVSHMSFISIADPMAKIRTACQRGAQVFYINPRLIESASPKTGEVIQILPDTDLYLMAALLHEMDALGRFDENVIREHDTRIDALRAFIAPYSAAKAGRARLDNVFFPSQHGEMRHIRGALAGNLLPDMILDDDNPIRALVVIAGNPLLSVGGEGRWRQALEKLDLLIVIDLFRNATGEYAHYLLPSADMLERPDLNICGLGMQYQPYVQYTDAVVPPHNAVKNGGFCHTCYRPWDATPPCWNRTRPGRSAGWITCCHVPGFAWTHWHNSHPAPPCWTLNPSAASIRISFKLMTNGSIAAHRYLLMPWNWPTSNFRP